jgi:predicted aldo/keto reductase-like oxidoreductase
MKYRTLGRTGVDISEISLGTERLSQQDAATIAATFHRAVEAGVTFFDLPGWWPELRDAEGAALPGPANPRELEAALAYENARDDDKDFSGIDANALWKLERRCVYCNHCLPCPESIPVGGLMKLLGSEEHHPDARTRSAYRALARRASNGTECGICVDRCPFGVDVPGRMHRAVEVFGA